MAAATAALVLVASFGAQAAQKKKSKKSSSKKKKSAQVEDAPAPRPPDPYRVTILTSDGVALAASWRPVPDRPNVPAVLLVHDFARDRRSFEALPDELLARGIATLAIDLRAHGESRRNLRTSTAVRLSPRLLGQPYGFPLDVEAATKWLRERAPTVGVLGLSLGANLAVLATANGWADAAVAVSPNDERLPALAGPRPAVPNGTFVVAAENDAGRAASARRLHEKGREPKRILVTPGAAHNLAVFTEEPEARSAALAWLAERLGARPPASPTPTRTPSLVVEPEPAFAETSGPTPTPTSTPDLGPTPPPPAPVAAAPSSAR